MQAGKRNFVLGLAALLVVSLAACGGGGGGGGISTGSQPGSSQLGMLRVSLTDAASTSYAAVNVTVEQLRTHQSATASDTDSGWSEITLNPPRKINLLNLTNGVLEDLGQTSLTAGHYTQLRLVLSRNTGTIPANSVVLTGTQTEIPLDTPSATQSGIKLIHEFDVAPGQRVDLVLDFDANKSVVKRGNSGKYLLKPVIRVLPMVLTGIDGFVDKSLLGDNVMVSSEVSGTVVRSTVPDAQTGEFFLSHLAPGNYDVVITADGHATAVITGVPVTNPTSTAVVTMVSTSDMPITMPTSTMGNIHGTLATNPSTSTIIDAFVATKQTFTGGGPTVTVKSEATELPGAYSLDLPMAAPLLGSYGTGSLPIAFAPQADIAGKYAVEVSATGYIPQSVNVDIFNVLVTQQSFTLIPMP